MRTIALVGFAPMGHQYAKDLPKDVELWTLNHAHKFGWRIDVLFEMHWREWLEDEQAYDPALRQIHLDYLKAEHGHAILMQKKHDDFPASVEYPLDDALELAGGKRFKSSFAYMAAMVMLQTNPVDRVEIYGFNMDYETEYRQQKPNALYWIGRMEGIGIDVWTQPESTLFEELKLYGYEAGNMVTRQAIEEHKLRFEQQEQDNKDKANHWTGVHEERTKNKQPQAIGSAEQVKKYTAQMHMATGAVRALQHLLDVCDLKEVQT